jgi:putative flippase GtrA
VSAEHPTALEADRSGGGPYPFLAKFGKFAVVGVTGVVVNLIVFATTLDAISPRPTFDLYANLVRFASSPSSNPLDNFIASAVAFLVATLWNFTLNNLWTFRAKVAHRFGLAHRLGLYYGVSLGSLAVNEAVLFVASFYLPPLLGQLIGIVAGSVIGFAGNYRFTFAEANLER